MAGLLLTALVLNEAACTKEPAAVSADPERTAKREQSRKIAEATQNLVVAKVNGVVLNMQELIHEMNIIAREYTGKKEKAILGSTEKIRKTALDNLIFKELAIQESVRLGIDVSPGTVDTVIGQMKTQMKEGFADYLKEKEMTEADLRTRIERGRRFELVTAREIYQKIAIDEAAVRKEYDKNKNAYKNGTSRELTYEEAALIIKRKMMAQVGEEKRKEWEGKLKKNATIVIAEK